MAHQLTLGGHEPAPCTGNGTGSSPRLACGHPSPSYPSRAACAAGLTDPYEPVQCDAGRWHHARRATVDDSTG